MPSGHATVSFAFALPLFVLTRPFLPLRWRIFPLVIAAAVAFSRPYVGVHYPSDILAGAVLGSSVAGAMCRVFQWEVRRYRRS
jgi:undecaprenyl-diphosphatase